MTKLYFWALQKQKSLGFWLYTYFAGGEDGVGIPNVGICAIEGTKAVSCQFIIETKLRLFQYNQIGRFSGAR